MSVNVKPVFRLIARRDSASRKAPAILEKHLKQGMETIAKRLMRSARARMRKDVGDEQKSLRYELKGQGMTWHLFVFSELVQAFVDAYGLRRGIFASFGVNSKLFRWALRRAKGIENKKIRKKNLGQVPGPVPSRKVQQVKRARSVSKSASKAQAKQGTAKTKRRMGAGERRDAKHNDARRISFLVARYIYRNGIRPTFWNRKALDANKTAITREIENAMRRATNEIKRLG